MPPAARSKAASGVCPRPLQEVVLAFLRPPAAPRAVAPALRASPTPSMADAMHFGPGQLGSSWGGVLVQGCRQEAGPEEPGRWCRGAGGFRTHTLQAAGVLSQRALNSGAQSGPPPHGPPGGVVPGTRDRPVEYSVSISLLVPFTPPVRKPAPQAQVREPSARQGRVSS